MKCISQFQVFMMKVLVLLFTLSSVFSYPTRNEIVKEPFLVGGNYAIPHSAPYIVSLQIVDLWHICGGSLLNVNWILSAAHCADSDDDDLQAVAGEHDFGTITGTEQTRHVVQRILHENYDIDEIIYDIAVLRVDTPFNLIPGIVELTHLPPIGRIHSGDVTLHGWGSTSREDEQYYPDILHTVTKPIIPNAICQSVLDSLFQGMRPLNLEVCTGPLNGDISACFGDSGGPLVQSVDGVLEQVGITSWISGVPCGQVNAPSVYVQVSGFIVWIHQHITA